MKKGVFLLLGIVLLAFILRLVGISYGLPLWVVPDEPPFIYAPLKMMEIKSLIPALHPDAFQGYLYFPPFLAYVLLVPFAIVLLVQYVFSGLPLDVFTHVASYDVSTLYIVARVISAIFGTLTVWLIYKVGKNLFNNEAPALLASLLLALSFLHVNFSHWIRHWSIVVFLFTFVIYILSSRLDHGKKYTMASLVSGLSFGFSYQGAISAFFIILWFLLVDRLSIKEFLKKKWPWLSAGLFILMVFIGYILYPDNQNINSVGLVGRDLMSWLKTLYNYFYTFATGEPFLFIFSIVGLVWGFIRKQRFVIVSFIFSLVYLSAFYFLFVNEGRYILMLYPLFVLVGGWGIYQTWSKFDKYKDLVSVSTFLLITMMLLTVIKLDVLLVRNDTRILARDWAIENIESDSKVATIARLFRLPSTAEAVDEQERLDPSSLRTQDRLEAGEFSKYLDNKKFYSLNLGTFSSENFVLNDLENYLRNNRFEYLVFSKEEAMIRGVDEELDSTDFGQRIYSIPGYKTDDNIQDITNGYGGGFWSVFNRQYSGPEIDIIKIQ